MFSRRRKGVLLHVTSLPGPYGVGDLGPRARGFARTLGDRGWSVWQVLPLGPVEGAFGFSPYASPSAFALNPLLVSPEDLREEGWIDEGEEAAARIAPARPDRAELERSVRAKNRLLAAAWGRARRDGRFREDRERFADEASGWLRDWCRFVALKERFGGVPWTDWPEALRDRNPEALAALDRDGSAGERMAFEGFVQFLAHRQLDRLKGHCAGAGVHLFGDLPIYVAADGADAWAHRELFQLDASGRPVEVAGVPPDYFSETGQRWGNPLFRWDVLEAQGFRWWVDRLRWTLRGLDTVRIDHFRGFCGYWAIPAGEATAVKGCWRPGPGKAFFDALHAAFGVPPVEDLPPGVPSPLPLVAEDLGVITEDVIALMHRYRLPGMRVLQFAFGGDGDNPHLPPNHEPLGVVYTGTHDNNTARGWWTSDATGEEKRALFDYLGRPVGAEEVPRELTRLALQSPSRLAVVPLQDLQGLPGSARMNRPASKGGNWAWRARSLEFPG